MHRVDGPETVSEMNEDTIKLVLTVVSGVCWTVVYIEGIRLGFRDRTYAMPFCALALNIAWEFVHTALGLKRNPDLQTLINGIWFLFDVGLLFTYFKFGKKYFQTNFRPHWFVSWSTIVLITAFLLEYAFILEFGQFSGGAYAAFLQNLLMSVLFINLFMQRADREGQSLLIAISKWIGTLAPTILFGLIGSGTFAGPNVFILIVGLLCSVFDLIYIFLLAGKRGNV